MGRALAAHRALVPTHTVCEVADACTLSRTWYARVRVRKLACPLAGVGGCRRAGGDAASTHKDGLAEAWVAPTAEGRRQPGAERCT
eukprot:scaffold3544_cov373-Prasinococcus_capsulatus_cf.AAC.5